MNSTVASWVVSSSSPVNPGSNGRCKFAHAIAEVSTAAQPKLSFGFRNCPRCHSRVDVADKMREQLLPQAEDKHFA
jgi:hypothetical protein